VESGELGRVFDLEERLIEFAALIYETVESLPDNRVGKHVAGQLLRCGTAPAPDYGEAQGAESRKDFVHRLRVCLKELRETIVWLKYARRIRIGDAALVQQAIDEADHLCAIMYSSIRTAERNSSQRS